MRITLLLLIAALAGCAGTGPTAATKEAETIKVAMRTASVRADECVDGILQSAPYREVSKHFTIADPTPEILADTGKPTRADVTALLAVHKLLTHCRTQDLVNLNAAHSGFVAVTAKTYAESDIDFGKLVRGEISWGRYGELTLERRQRHLARRDQAVRAIGADLRSQHASEVQERQNATRALAAWTDAQRVSLPTFTQCMYVLAGITCTTF
jgi:hypothetical protein